MECAYYRASLNGIVVTRVAGCPEPAVRFGRQRIDLLFEHDGHKNHS